MPGHTVRQPVLRNPLDAMVARFFAEEDRDLSQVRVVRDVKRNHDGFYEQRQYAEFKLVL